MKNIFYLLTALVFMATTLTTVSAGNFDTKTKHEFHMKTYKVIALSVGGRGAKIFNSGDIVKENNFLPGRADQLVKEGFLTCIGTDKEEAPKEAIEPTMKEVIQSPETVDNLADQDIADFTDPEIKTETTETVVTQEKTILEIDAFDVSDIKRNLDNYKIKYSSNASKKELYDLYVSEMLKK